MTATWRLRVELTDRPGALARLATSLAARDCNILALTVLPVPDGVIDDLVVRVPAELRPADLVTMVRGIGGRCAGITAADVTELTDAPTFALRAVTRLADGSASYAETVRALVDADAAVAERGPVTVRAADGGEITVRRGWAPFTEVELARAGALADLVSALGATDATAVVTDGGAGVVLREGRPADADAVAAMHDRCSRASLFARYHAGTRTIPRRLLHRLLAPPRGRTVVGLVGHQVVAVGQLINTDHPLIGEVSLLVEDDWQRQGVGSALLAHLARTARAGGHTELFGWCLPGEQGLSRAAHRAGFEVAIRHEDNLLRVALSTREPLGANA
ncbi:MAG TPA: GNAT family N-acetyltransferase [Pseudonocardiaceae bacterium]|jgi:GNAT superfamily N-acetyltransferase|nr:GNAT family N-acetyltransferase [Pseudonocardiaceae bacterium]